MDYFSSRNALENDYRDIWMARDVLVITAIFSS